MPIVTDCQVIDETGAGGQRKLVVTIDEFLVTSPTARFLVVLSRECSTCLKQCWEADVVGESIRLEAQCHFSTSSMQLMSEWTLRLYKCRKGDKYVGYADLTSELARCYNRSLLHSKFSSLSLATFPSVTDVAQSLLSGNQFSGPLSTAAPTTLFSIDRSTYSSATIRWDLPSGFRRINRWMVVLRKVLFQSGLSSVVSERLWRVPSYSRHLSMRSLEPGQVYAVEVIGFTSSPLPGTVATQQFRAELTKEDLGKLLSKAMTIQTYNVVSEEYIPIRWLYRHKTPEYYTDIETNHGGIMKVYTKDINGDPASCINGQIKGLFFSANVDFTTRAPMELSTFGSRRFLISCTKMFQNAPNLYFADVYCTVSKVHTVSLVMTRPGSEADRFCMQKLIPLPTDDEKRNPFLFVKGKKAFVSSRIMIEVLYTEDINIRQCLKDTEFDAKFETCFRPANGRHGGRPKQPRCEKCNVKPKTLWPGVTDTDSDSD